MEIDINLIRGLVLIALILGFIGIVAWAWSRKRKPHFDRMSRLPLEEDTGQVPDNDERNTETKE
ncbi:MAG: cbb3-type cytochrome c oxidase subunit 3 [Lysobacterales bacterium]|jgi:cytochrome c oxidase cbb3-type subunit 4